MSSSRRLQGSALLLVLASAAITARLARQGDPASAAGVPAPPAATARPGPPGPSREEVLKVMNSYRERHGLRPLRLNPRLNAAADDRIRDMFGRRYFDHVAPDGTEPYVWVRRRGYRYTMVGENLATGHEDAREVVDEWMRSAHHRANILGAFEESGIAFAPGSPTGRRAGYTFVVLYATASLRTGDSRLGAAVRLARSEAQAAPSRARRPRPCPATIAA